MSEGLRWSSRPISEELSINVDSARNRSSSSGFHSSALEWRALISSSSTEGFGAAAGCRLSSAGARFMYRLNPRPRKPATTNKAPATISQCGYSISESTSFPLRLSPSSTIAGSPRSRGCTIGGSSYVIQQRTFHLRATHVMVSSEITWAAMVRRPMCLAARVR